MWKIIVGFIAFAALSMFVILKGGDKIDMKGETNEHAAAESASAEASAPAPAASALPAASK